MEIQLFGFGLDPIRNTSFCFGGSRGGNFAYPEILARSREDHGEKIPQGRWVAEESREILTANGVNQRECQVGSARRSGPKLQARSAVRSISLFSTDNEWLTIAGVPPAPHAKSPKLIGFGGDSRKSPPVKKMLKHTSPSGLPF